MNALSYFFAAFLLFAGQAHGNIFELFSERFAQARIPTQEDFIMGETMKLACNGYVYNGGRNKIRYYLTLSEEPGVVDVLNNKARVKYLVFTNQGLEGVWADDMFASFKSVYRIEDNGKWIQEWSGQLNLTKDIPASYQIWWGNATPSVADPDYRIISYTICVKTEEGDGQMAPRRL